jgi:hypothetical protein
MRRLHLVALAASLVAAPAFAQTAPLHPPSTPTLGDSLGFTTGIAASLPKAESADAAGGAAPRAQPGQTVRDASGHVVGKVVRVAGNRADGSTDVTVRGAGGKLTRAHIESFTVNGDAWLGGPEDLKDPRMVWY